MKYKRIDIQLCLATEKKAGEVVVDWDDSKTARIDYFIGKSVIDQPAKPENILILYQAIFNCMLVLWKNNQWNEHDLELVFENIRSKRELVFIEYARNYKLPQHPVKATFCCEVFPEYANYYLHVFERRTKVLSRILFLKGTPELDLFFSFFLHPYWKDPEHFILADINKEIFFVFNIKAGNFSVEFSLKYNSLEECKNYLHAFEAGISRKERLRLMGLPYSA